MDDNGHFVILQDNLSQQPITLIGVYAPNDQQTAFWENLLSCVKPNTPSIMMGNFNAAFDNKLDRSKLTKSLTIPKIFFLNYG